MASDNVSALAGGFRFNAASSPPAFTNTKFSKRRGLNRSDSLQDQWEFAGANPFAGGGVGRNLEFGKGGVVGSRIGCDGSDSSHEVEIGAVPDLELPDALRKLNLGKDTNLANESGTTDANFDALDRGFIFECSLGKDRNPSSVRMNVAPSDNVENKLKTGGVSGVPLAEAVSLESNSHEGVTGEWTDDCRNPAMETMADAASGRGSKEDGLYSSSGGSRLEENGGFRFIGKQSHDANPFVGFNAPTSEVNLESSATAKIEFAAKREMSDLSRFKKKKGKSKPSAHVQSHLMLDLGANVDYTTGKQEASDSYSPLNMTPYQQILDDNRSSTQYSATSKDPNILDKDSISDVSHTYHVQKNSKDNLDEELISSTQRMGVCGDSENGEVDEDASLHNSNIYIDTRGPVEEHLSGAASESFKSSTDGIEVILDDSISSSQRSQASSSYCIESEDDQKGEARNVAVCAEGTPGSSFIFMASSSHQGQSSIMRRKTKKKPSTSTGCCSFKLSSCSEDSFTTVQSSLSSEVQSVTSHNLESINQFTNPSELGRRADSNSVKGGVIDLGLETISATGLAAQEACEKWRLRGNQAYTSGDALKAEECYTQGIDSIQKDMASRSCSRALMLCYSNRAAVRMSLGRLNDALQDCMMAMSLDPYFFKVQVRAANCFLSLGNINNALHYYKQCLQPGNDTCTDRKIIVEASDGLQNAQKLSECINQSTELLMRKTPKDVESALEVADEALLISPFSERLLQMKAEALFVLQKYEEVIRLCEDTLDSAVKNSSPTSVTTQTNSDCGLESSRQNFRVWRCRLMFQSLFQLGRLEQGVALIERNDISDLGAEQHLVDSARELLRLKTAGNEAFRSGRYAEAVENYTAALSCNVQSSPFAAICFCNRAAAYKASGQILDAIADCSLVIALTGNYIKAISRRATLFEMIRDYEQAAADLQRLVSALTKQLEEITDRVGGNDSLLSYAAELRQTHMKLAEMEDEARKDIPLDMYLILGVESSASMSQIKKAYRKAALRHHPDKATQFLSRNENGDDKIWKAITEEVNKDADRLFKMIGVAYAVLSDPVKRSQHDAEEEMRKAHKKHAAASTSRTCKSSSNPPPFERSVRKSHSEVWRCHSSRQAQGPESSSWTRYK